MTFEEYQNLETFPIEMVTHIPYRSDLTNLKKGDTFTAVGKQLIEPADFSVIDDKGHPHYFEWCDKLYKQ